MKNKLKFLFGFFILVSLFSVNQTFATNGVYRVFDNTDGLSIDKIENSTKRPGSVNIIYKKEKDFGKELSERNGVSQYELLYSNSLETFQSNLRKDILIPDFGNHYKTFERSGFYNNFMEIKVPIKGEKVYLSVCGKQSDANDNGFITYRFYCGNPTLVYFDKDGLVTDEKTFTDYIKKLSDDQDSRLRVLQKPIKINYEDIKSKNKLYKDKTINDFHKRIEELVDKGHRGNNLFNKLGDIDYNKTQVLQITGIRDYILLYEEIYLRDQKLKSELKQKETKSSQEEAIKNYDKILKELNTLKTTHNNTALENQNLMNMINELILEKSSTNKYLIFNDKIKSQGDQVLSNILPNINKVKSDKKNQTIDKYIDTVKLNSQLNDTIKSYVVLKLRDLKLTK